MKKQIIQADEVSAYNKLENFGNNSCFNFKQLKDGRWVGTSFSGYYISFEYFDQGEPLIGSNMKNVFPHLLTK